MAATAYDESQWVFNVGEPVEKIFIVIPNSTLRLGSQVYRYIIKQYPSTRREFPPRLKAETMDDGAGVHVYSLTPLKSGDCGTDTVGFISH
jgi:hypothetical protein